MFRLTCFVDDKQLAKVKWLLHGHVYNLTDEPVINARKTATGDVKARTPAGKRSEMFKAWLRKHKNSTIIPGDIKRFCESVGLRQGSYSNILADAIEEGLLRRRGSEFRYTILRGKPAKKPRKAKARKTKLKVVSSTPKEAA